MGLDVRQYGFIGFEIEISDLEFIIEPEQTIDRAVYDKRTGNIVRYQKEVIKEEISGYRLYHFVGDDIEALLNEIRHECKVEYETSEDGLRVAIGIPLSNLVDSNIDRFRLLNGFTAMDKVYKAEKTMKQKFPDREIGLVFVGHVSC